jgi:hypothetical protein
MAFEPMVVPIYQAWGNEPTEVNVESLDLKNEEIDLTRLVKPLKILRDGLIQRGGYTKDLVFARAWANWAQLMSQAYLLYGRESHEMITMERAMDPKFVKDVLSPVDAAFAATKFLIVAEACLGAIGNRLRLAVSGGRTVASTRNWVIGLHRLFTQWNSSTQNLINGNRVLSSLDNISTNPTWQGFNRRTFVSAYTDVPGQAGTLGANATRIFGPIRVALSVLSLYLLVDNAMRLPETTEFQTGFENTLTGVSLFMDAVGIIAFMLPPPVGAVVAVIGLVITIVQAGISVAREWMSTREQAYQDSHRFLMDCDPEFRSFCNNQDSWDDSIKSESMKSLEEFVQSVGGADQFRTEPDVPVRRGLESAMNLAKVMTYYNRDHSSSLMDDRETLHQLWEDKMDYMQWRPTERDRDYDEDASRQGVWGRVRQGFGNIWYNVARRQRENLAPIGQLINRDNIREDIPKVLYNPDFYLYRQIKRWNEPGHPGLVRWIKYRFETAPYHFIPLVELWVRDWGTIGEGGPIRDAMLCDQYICSLKSLKAIGMLIKGVADHIQEQAEGLSDHVTSVSEDLIDEKLRPQIQGLYDLGRAYTASATGQIPDDLWEVLEEKLEFDPVPEGQERTAENVVRANRLFIQNHLNLFPYITGNLQAQALLAVDSTVGFFLLFKIFQHEITRRARPEAEQMLTEIRHEKFRRFVESGEYLCFTNGILSRPFIPRREMRNALNSCTQEDGEVMRSFQRAVDNLAVVDDHPFGGRAGRYLLSRYRNRIKWLQARTIQALEIWENLEDRTNVTISVPHNALTNTNPNAHDVLEFGSMDAETKEIFFNNWSDQMFRMDGSPTVADPGFEQAALSALEHAAVNDSEMADLFEEISAGSDGQ